MSMSMRWVNSRGFCSRILVLEMLINLDPQTVLVLKSFLLFSSSMLKDPTIFLLSLNLSDCVGKQNSDSN